MIRPSAPPSPPAITPLPLPPDGFDPLARAPDILLRYGLPVPRPGEGPAAAAFRRAFLAPPAGRPLRYVLALPQGGAPGPGRSVPARTQGLVPAGRSVNWSGGSLAAPDVRSFVGVMARWRVPAVSGEPGRPARASAWIGLDGQGFYRNASLPQIGTLQTWDGAVACYETWVQWWARGEEHPPQTLGLDVAPGEEVAAMLTLVGPATVRFNLKNETTGAMLQAFDVTAPGGRRVTGATAEWILERPSPLGSDGWHPFPLADYGSFPFTDCLAQSRAPGGGALAEHDLARAALIRMIAIEADPARIRTISYPTRVPKDPQALTMTFGSPF